MSEFFGPRSSFEECLLPPESDFEALSKKHPKALKVWVTRRKNEMAWKPRWPFLTASVLFFQDWIHRHASGILKKVEGSSQIRGAIRRRHVAEARVRNLMLNPASPVFFFF
jgi:hypothetical protein